MTQSSWRSDGLPNALRDDVKAGHLDQLHGAFGEPSELHLFHFNQSVGRRLPARSSLMRRIERRQYVFVCAPRYARRQACCGAGFANDAGALAPFEADSAIGSMWRRQIRMQGVLQCRIPTCYRILDRRQDQAIGFHSGIRLPVVEGGDQRNVDCNIRVR